MSPLFKVGAFESVKRTLMRNAPIIAGAGAGALIGNVLSPKEEPGKYKTQGAIVGGFVGYTRLNRWRSKLGPRWQVTL
jgi:hypothetical protein